MPHETDYFLSQDGIKLFYRSFFTDNPRYVVCLVHGLGEHSGRYTHVADHLTKNDIAVFALDLRGHGQSGGRRGHTRSYELLLSDTEELLKTARAEFTELPIYLMGHSMGGNLVANYMIHMNTNELAGCILSASWLRLAFDPPAWKQKLGKWLARTWPAISLPSELHTCHLCRDKDVVKAYENDTLVHDRISAGLFADLFRHGSMALERAAEISKRALIYHGSEDRITDWRASEALAKAMPNAEWHLLEGVFHEPHNDPDQSQVLDMISAWIKTG